MQRITFMKAMTAGLGLLAAMATPVTGQARMANATSVPGVGAQADSMERVSTQYRLTAAWAPPPGKTQAQYDENEKYRAWKRKWSETLKKAAAERRRYLANGTEDEKQESRFNQQYLQMQATMTSEAKKFDAIAAVMKPAPRAAAAPRP